MNGLLNNREIALIFWTGAFIIFAATKSDVRQSFSGLVKQFVHPKIFIPLLLSSTPVLIAIYLLHHMGLWNLSILKETIIWAAGTGIVMFFNSTSAQDGKLLFRKIAKDSLKLVIILEFIINFYVFPLWFEFLLVPFVTLASMLTIYANTLKDKKYDATKKFLNWLTVAAGLLITYFAILGFLSDPKLLFTAQNLELFLLPIILTFAYMPTIYLLGLYSSYENMFSRIGFFLEGQKNKSHIKIACFRRCLLSLKRTNNLAPILVLNLTTQTSREEALEIIRKSEI